MPALRTMTCPTCGRKHLLGAPCGPVASDDEGQPVAWPVRAAFSIVIIALTAGLLTTASLATAAAYGKGYGLAIACGAWVIMQLLRLGYEYDEGIDIKQLLLPAPFDWSVKVERLVHFWATPQVWFRAIYLGSVIAAALVIMRLAGKM